MTKNEQQSDNLTAFINGELSDVNQADSERMMTQMYSMLKRIAQNNVRTERDDLSLCATELVHESYLNLGDYNAGNWQDRAHFYRVISMNMRKLLVDRARYHAAHKRLGKKDAIPLDENLVLSNVAPNKVIELDDYLKELEEFDPDLAELIQLKYFVGLTLTEIAEMQGSSLRTVERRFALGKAWLSTQFKSDR